MARCVPIAVQPKLDGYRCIAQRAGDRVAIYFEDSKEDRSKKLRNFARELKALKGGDFILDGEVTEIVDGKPTQRVLLGKFKSENPDDSHLVYWVFDILYWEDAGGDLHDKPLRERRAALDQFFKKQGKLKHLKYVPQRVVRSKEQLRKAVKWANEFMASEGAFMKTVESTYPLSGRSKDWCLSPEMRVWTPNGPTPIGDLKQGDVVYDDQGETQVVEVAHSAANSIMRISLGISLMPDILATAEHRFFVGYYSSTGEWQTALKQVNELTANDYLFVPRLENMNYWLYHAPDDKFYVRVTGVSTFAYDGTVVHIQTESEKFIVEGVLSHNSKLKYCEDIVVRVLEKNRTKAGTYNYLCGVSVPAEEKDKYTPIYELNGRFYVVLGKTYNVPLEAEPGDNLEVRVEEINIKKVGDKLKLAWQDPNPKDKNVDDPVADVERALAIAELLAEKLMPGR